VLALGHWVLELRAQRATSARLREEERP
jgi:hypothetical protein